MQKRSMTFKKIAMVAMMVLLAAGAVFAGGQKEGRQVPSVLRIGWGSEGDSLSPFICYTQAGSEIIHLIYDSLLNFDENLQPVSNLAESWETSADNLTWTFHLKKGVKWHDGVDFTSADVKYTYERLLDTGLGLFADSLAGISTIECPDADTVVLHTEKPKANMLMVTTPILPEHIWTDVSDDDLEIWENESPVGTGPFKFVEWQQGEYLKLAANKDYFGKVPDIDELVFVLYANADTMGQAIKTGELGAAIYLNATQIKTLKEDKNVDVISGTMFGFTELSFNCTPYEESLGNPILMDKKVRQAIEYAMDKNNIIDVAYSGQGNPGTTIIVPDDFWHYEPTAAEIRNYNLAKAKAVLEEAGYTDKDGDGIRENAAGDKMSFTLTCRSDSTDEIKAGQMIAGNLKDAGIEITIETVDDGLLLDKIYSYDFDMFIWGWGTDVDPTIILRVMSTDQIGNNSDCNYSNPVYDQMLLDQATIIDKAERQKMVWEMQKIIYEDAPYIVLTYDISIQAVRTDMFTGWKQIPENGPYIYNLTWYNYLNVKPVR